jgi:ATP adenylyltransferase
VPHASTRDEQMIIPKGTLWKRIVTTSEQAIASGALLSTPTNQTSIEENGIRFFVRVLAGLRQKDEAKKQQESAASAGKHANPFLPPEKDLTIGDVSDNHIAVLNKFNVVDHHLLVVTRRFEDQETLLTLRDFEALWFCLAEFDCLTFYNGGRDAGASQQHKHLQFVPLPLAPGGPAVPIEPLINRSNDHDGTVPDFSFLHAFQRLGPDLVHAPAHAAQITFDYYAALLKKVGMTTPAAGALIRQDRPYCFLMTRSWMFLIPRTKEFFEDISLNSLAFVGSFFVRNETQLDRLRSVGPLTALRSVSMPKG